MTRETLSGSIRSKLPTLTNIRQAETARHRKEFNGVHGLLYRMDKLSTANLATINEDGSDFEQRKALSGGRLMLVTQTTEMQQDSDALQAYGRLNTALNIHQRFYEDPATIEMEEKTFTRGRVGKEMLVEFKLERQRDTARLLFAAAEITGNTNFLQAGIDVLTKAINAIEAGETPTPEDQTIIPLIYFERARVETKLAGDKKTAFAKQTEYYHEAYNKALDADNHERAATIAAWQSIDAQKMRRKTAAREAEKDFYATNESFHHILADQRAKADTEKARRKRWNRTRKKVDRNLRDSVNQALDRVVLFTKQPSY